MENLKLPIGFSDFAEIRRQGLYYVDKTLMCEQLFNDTKKAILVTRPRRFGKTLNLSMLRYFFASEIRNQKTASLFKGTLIEKKKAFCRAYQGKYPVILISLKDINTKNFDMVLSDIQASIVSLYNQFTNLRKSDKLTDTDKRIFQKTLDGNLSESELQHSISRLAEYTTKHYGIPPILLIDEYDVAIQGAYLNDFYEPMINFMRVFLGKALKDDDNITRALITGVTRVSKESVFSGINNLIVCSLHDNKYGEFFGFVESDVKALVEESKLDINFDELTQWYDGYLSGDIVLYNPWSILCAIDNKGKFDYYWVNTSGNEILEKFIINGTNEFYTCLERLVQDKSIQQLVDPHVVFKDLDSNTAAIWSLLYNTGYLKITHSEPHYASLKCKLKIPNREVKGLFYNLINKWVNGKKGLQWYENFMSAIIKGEIDTICRNLQAILLHVVSYHDTQNPDAEKFYHGLMLGLTTGLMDTYYITSNRETGFGRHDIMLIPKKSHYPGYIFELKKENEKNLNSAAKQALKQIQDKQYDAPLNSQNVKTYYQLGLAFSQKEVQVAYQKITHVA